MKNSKIKISQMFRIDYFQNRNVFFSNDYNLGKIKTNLLISDLKEIKFCMNDIKKADKSITKEKIKRFNVIIALSEFRQ
jgi:hypothetical protein